LIEKGANENMPRIPNKNGVRLVLSFIKVL